MTSTELPRDTDGRLSAYAWPGGYPLFYIGQDEDEGSFATFCVSCARQEDAEPPIVAAEVNYENDEWCDGCGAAIERAYA